jgi:hypothetical protein
MTSRSALFMVQALTNHELIHEAPAIVGGHHFIAEPSVS